MADDNPRKFAFIKRLQKKLFPAPRSREQLISLLRESTKKKIIANDALAMIEGVMQVSEMQVRDIMVPKTQMVVVEHDAPIKEFLPIIIESQHSRFPVIGENRDEVIGILLAKDLLRFAFENRQRFNIQKILRPAVFIPESKRLNVLLREFRINRNHMAIVLDEYGSVSGFVTIEDVLEQIVGEIKDEYDLQEEKEGNIKKISRTQFNVKAFTPITDFNEYFDAKLNDENLDTIGGLVAKNFGHLPRRGESVKINDFNFKILNADNRRIHLLRITLPRKTRVKVNE